MRKQYIYIYGSYSFCRIPFPRKTSPNPISLNTISPNSQISISQNFISQNPVSPNSLKPRIHVSWIPISSYLIFPNPIEIVFIFSCNINWSSTSRKWKLQIRRDAIGINFGEVQSGKWDSVESTIYTHIWIF